MKIKKTRYRFRFLGRVQGVGFRYTASALASSLGISGWILNDYDGSVLMEVQGYESSINKMILRLKNDRFIYIENIEKTEIPLQEDSWGFYVRG